MSAISSESSKQPTIARIAEEAGMSVSTVSRALNNHPRISEKTKQKIQRLAEELGYSPNLFARALVKKQSFLIGILGFDFRNLGMSVIAFAAQEVVEKSGYWMIQANTHEDQQRANSIIKSWIRMGLDGIIYASCSQDNDYIESLIESGFPLVLVNRRLRKEIGDYVIFDHEYGAFFAVNHLLNLGYTRIGMINGFTKHSSAVDRLNGYKKALQQRSIEIDKHLIHEGSYTRAYGYQAMNKVLASGNPPQAVFCCDDNVALGVMRALGEKGLRIPEDIAIVGVDDIDIASHPRIQLTTVKQDLNEMGRLGAEILLDRIEGTLNNESRKIMLEPQLIIRRSCGYKRDLGKK